MKKRLLALCLAAAMLLGMMPALTLAASAEIVTETIKVAVDNPVTDPNFVYTPSGAFGWQTTVGGWYRIRATAGANAYVTFGANVDLDHTKQVAVSHILTVDGGNFAPIDTFGEKITLNDGTLAYNGVLYTLKDGAANGGTVYTVLHKRNGTQCDLAFLVPNGESGFTVEIVRLQMVPARNAIGLIWNVNGTVTVQVDGSTMGTTANNVTWTHAQVTAAGMPVAEEGFRGTLHCEDYTDTSVHPYALSQVYLFKCTVESCGHADGEHDGITVSHTYEAVEPAQLDSYFTAETLTADNALNEESWSYADFDTVGGYNAAVLVNMGTAYVALKSDTATDGTTVTVKLGETEKSATFAGGVAEVSFPNAVSGYDTETELTVGAEKAPVTFVAKAITTQPTFGETATTKVAIANPITDPNFAYVGTVGVSDNSVAFNWLSSYYRLRAAAGGRESVTFGANVDLDHTKQVAVSHVLTVDIGNFAPADPYGDNITLNNGNLAYNGILYTLKDSAANGGVVYAVLHPNSGSQLTLSFIVPDGNGGIALEYVRLGMVPSRNAIGLIWNVNGTVTVQIDGTTKATTAKNVTWTNAQASIMPAADEGFRATLHCESYTDTKVHPYGLAQVYLWPCVADCAHDADKHVGITVDQTECIYTEDIETTLEDDLYTYFDTFDTENVVSLPAAFEHPYLGIVPLSWGCEIDGLVSPNGVIKTPLEDTWAVVWAEVDGEVLFECEVCIKAAEPIYGAFATDVDAGWNLISFTQIGDSADSVAVLAKDKDNVYVAVKSAAASATVTLGTEEQTVEIIDGIGYAAFENVGLSAFGDSRELKVVTANGTLEKKVVLDNQINLDAANGTTTKVMFGSAHAADPNFIYSAINETLAHRLRIRASASGDNYYGTSLDLDHTKQVSVAHNFYIDGGNFNTSDGAVTLNGGILAYNGILFTLTDTSAEGGVVYALFYRSSDREGAFRFILPDGNGGITLTDPMYMGNRLPGVNTAGVVYTTEFIWNVDGTVTVNLREAGASSNWMSKTTSVNVTWTQEQAKIMPTTTEGFKATMHFEDYSFSQYALAQMYLFKCDSTADCTKEGCEHHGIQVTHSEPIVDIEIPTFQGWSVDLGSDIGLNFFLNMPVKTGAVANVSLAGEPFKTVDFSALKPGADGRYMAEANIAAVQMTEEIKVELSVFGFAIDAQTMTSTVKAYVEELKKPEYALTEAQNTLVDAMLTYGAAAQKYFSYKTDALASTAAPSEALKNESGSYAASVEGSLTGVTAKSATLLLQERVVIRYYFDVDTVEGLTFKLGDKALNPVFHETKGYYYVDVAVVPQNMAETYTVTVAPAEGEGSLSVSYSCMTYLVNKADSQVANLSTLMMAMYDYYVAAAAVAN